MTTLAHTPGPWKWDGKFRVCIPHASGETCFRTNPEDAALIVRAPELAAENAELRAALRNLLSCEPKNAANYIRQEFAAARALLARLDGAR